MEVFGKDCHEIEVKKRSLSCNESSAFKNQVLDATLSELKRPKSTMLTRQLHPSVLEHKREKRSLKSDASIRSCSKLLNVANLSLAEPRNHDKQVTKGTVYIPKTKKIKDQTAIADMSKIITKYDEAERRYIGTTIELVKKDHKKPSGGRAVWNKMPTHRLGFPNNNRQLAQMPKIDQEELSHKLKNSVAVSTYELQDRRCCMQTMATKEILATTSNSQAGTKARSERVTRFLTEAFEANADILGLGIPFKPAESKVLTMTARCTANNEDQALSDNKTRSSTSSILYHGTEKNSNTKLNNLKRIKVSCIHFKPNDGKETAKTVTFEETDERCNLCYQAQTLLPDQKFPQAPPTTPIKQSSSKKRTLSFNKLGVNDLSVSRFRTQTH